LETNVFNGDAIALLSVNPASIYPGIGGGVFSQNIVGCASLPCLVPCRSEAADHSPTNFVYDLKLAPDVVIKQLIQTNGVIQGVNFMWDSEATFLLQGTADLKHWTNVAYLWSNPPETIWTTNQTLNRYGSYFRLELVTDGHSTNVPPLVTKQIIAPNTPAIRPPAVKSCQLIGGQVVVNFTSAPGYGYLVQALDSRLIVRQSQPVISSGTSVTVNFDPATLPNPVYFQVVLSP
jgi:hypothetical protein